MTALFKSSDRCNANNFRPVAILPTVSKILKKAAHRQIYNYLVRENILTPKQFGFHPKLSTRIALAHFTDTVLENMDKGRITGAIFLDSSKAFDTVSHDRLIYKLDYIGFSYATIDWVKSYLLDHFLVTTVRMSHRLLKKFIKSRYNFYPSSQHAFKTVKTFFKFYFRIMYEQHTFNYMF